MARQQVWAPHELCLTVLCAGASQVEFTPIYLPDSPSSEEVLAVLDQKLFLKPGSLKATVGCKPAELSVIVAGAPGDVATGLSQSLARRGVPRERLLFCDYF